VVGDDVTAVATSAIQTIFSVYQDGTVIGLVLPDGWYGRPWDNYYELEHVASVGGVVEAGLGHGWKISFRPAGVSTPSVYELLLYGEDIRMDSVDDSRRYDRGEVRFVVSNSSTVVDRIADTAASDLASIPNFW
jgi:hypothetical protein